MKARFWALPMVLCFAMMLIVAPVFAATFEPRSKQSQQLKALVDKAAALVEREGQHAFPEFRKKGSAWYKGDLAKEASKGKKRGREPFLRLRTC